MTDFMTLWQHFHPGCFPVSDFLKHDETGRWLRLHSLPGSKRYADSEGEMAIILERQTTLAREVLGDGEPCWMSSYVFVPEPGIRDYWQDRHQVILAECSMQTVCRLDDPNETEPDEIRTFDIVAARTRWQAERFLPLLRAIADDETRIMWMSEKTGSVFAPYDGGIDLLLSDPAAVSAMALKHAEWLSPRRDGY